MKKKRPGWRTAWVDPPEVEALLDVSTAACTSCGQPARVPEDVVAVFGEPGKQPRPFVVCPNCTPAFTRFMSDEIRRRMGP